MSTLTRRRAEKLQAETLHWYQDYGRRLPWRGTSDPYQILVSEIMLQQTQVSRVIPKYRAFLTQFPTVVHLSRASRASVITAWQGLGYNRRALYLQRAAQIIGSNPGGWIPDLEWLRSLPGIGRYTAGAVMNFAFGIDTPAVDTNVKRFIDWAAPSRERRTENEYYLLAKRLMPPGQARVWLHAVMDYSALVLRKPRRRLLGSTLRVPSRSSGVFVGSNRYLRGRTIDQLRHSAQTLDELFARVAAPINVERGRYEQLISTLQAEGFLEQRGQLLQLQSSA
ncbi:hypothetical protein HY375_02755 [Candidatus Berkelbacteria bacterium]|nr:hypothetical protein [Candidatus Berkelbacteria bacterium]